MKLVLTILACIFLFSCDNSNNKEISSSDISNKSFLKLEPNRYNVALLVIDGTFNTELTAPMDIFHHTIFRQNIKSMNVFTISNTDELVRTFEGLYIKPDFNYLDSIPEIDILVIPAAEHNLDTDLDDEALIDFVKSAGESAEYVMSHCDGAFILAKTGLLDNRFATTFPGDIEPFKKMFPLIKVIEDVLFVSDDKYITSAGGAKSFEPSLYLCEKLYGNEVAQELAKGMVIDWKLDSISFFVTEN